MKRLAGYIVLLGICGFTFGCAPAKDAVESGTEAVTETVDEAGKDGAEAVEAAGEEVKEAAE